MDLCNPKEIKALLGRHGFHFSKSKGQNFLIQSWVPQQAAEASALAESLNRFLEELPQEKRVLFVRRYWYLCSIEELAAWSGKRRGTVSAELFRLRARLREHLEKEGFDL